MVPSIVSCFQKNEFTTEMVNCSTLVVKGNPQVANGQHHWNFGDGSGWHFYGNTEEAITLCNGSYLLQHFQEQGTLLCQALIEVGCGNFTITETEDPCTADFACFKFKADFCASTSYTWDFGDGTPPISCNCPEVEHCYTNVNTFTSTNTVVMPRLTVNGHTNTDTLDIANYDTGIFIGIPNTLTKLTDYNLVLPNNGHNGSAGGEPVYIYGTVNVDKTFTFTDTKIVVEQSGGLNIRSGNTFTTQAGTEISSAQACPCLWRGIDVLSGATLRANQGTTLKDALYAVRSIRSSVNPVIGLRGVNFIDNYIGLVAAPPEGSFGNGNFTFDGTVGSGFVGNTFSSSHVKEWCGGGNYVNNAFGPSGGLFSSDRGWAGVYLAGVTNFQVPITTSGANHFTNLANGIYMVNSSATGVGNFSGIFQCRFTDIQREGYPAAWGGHGIYFLDTQGGNAFSQNGFGMGSTDPASFTNCEVGIHAESRNGATFTAMNSHDNRMEGMEFGYFIKGVTGAITTEIKQNRITSNVEYGHTANIAGAVWIEDRYPQTKQHIIEENIMVVDQPDSPFGFGVFIIGSYGTNNNNAVNSVSVGNNIGDAANPAGITVVNGSNCVRTSNYAGVNVHNNIMLAQESTVDLRGIAFFGGTDNLANCNLVEGPDGGSSNIPNVAGISSVGSLGVNIQDNDIEGFDKGISIGGNNGNATLSCNDLLGVQDIGLLYSTDAVTGFQIDRGNRWLGSYNQWGAEHDMPSLTLNNNRFFARINTSEWPPTISPNTIWFFESSVEPQCPTESNCQTPPGQLMEDSPTELDNLIAQGSFNQAEGGLLWDLEAYLYGRLVSNEVNWQGNSLLEDFVAVRQNATLGQFHAIGEGIGELYAISVATQAQLDANREVMEAKHNALSTIHEAIANAQQGAQYESLVQQCQALEDAISELHQANVDICDNLRNARLQQADVLIATNNAITTTASYQTNEKTFFHIYLSTIGKDVMNATEGQIAALYDIAIQCPSEGGRAVYWAIGLYGQLTGEILEVQECGQTGEREAKGKSLADGHPEKGNFEITPNPVDGTSTATCRISSPTDGELLVMNLWGIKQATYPIKAGNSSIVLGQLQTGTYLVTLIYGDEIVQTKKLIIQ